MKWRARKRIIKGRTYRDFVADLGLVDGKRRVEVFKTRAEAEACVAKAEELRRERGRAVAGFSSADVARFAAADERLAKAGATIEQAVEFFLASHRPVKERVTLGALLDRCVLDMELRGVASNTIATFACACRSFVESRMELGVESVTREDVQRWIFSHGWEPRTQRGYLSAVTQLLGWAVDEGFLSVSPLKPDFSSGRRRSVIKLPKLVRKEPAIFSVEQIEHLFRVAETRSELGVDAHGRRGRVRVYRRLLGFLALATFGGIRPFELTRLDCSALDLEAGVVPLDARVTKTSDRRVVELSPNAVAWLRMWREEFPEYRVIAPPSWDRLMKQLRKVSELVPWPHDVLRHCFASYFHATHGDKARLQNQMGHSLGEDTLEKHYRAVRLPDGRPVTRADAGAFWGIFPRAVG